MMVKMENTYPVNDDDRGVSGYDRHISADIMKVAGALGNVSSQRIYIVDTVKMEIEYGADNLRVFSPRKIANLLNLYDRGIEFINMQPQADKNHLSLSCHLHSDTTRQPILFNHKLTPLTFSENGNVRLALCSMSFAATPETGKLSVTNHKTKITLEYSDTRHAWEEKKMIELSAAEKAVLVLSAQGHTINEIAGIICKSVDSVKSCKRGIFKKTGLHKITEVIIYAQNHNLI